MKACCCSLAGQGVCCDRPDSHPIPITHTAPPKITITIKTSEDDLIERLIALTDDLIALLRELVARQS